MPSSFKLEHLDARHDLSDFDCGVTSLTVWLQQSALNAHRMGTARTSVWTDPEARVRAYFSLAPHVVRRADTPPKAGRGSPDVLPAILLARLALDRRFQGKGMGGVLLVDAMATAVEAARRAGGRLIVVDAIDERASAFYRRHNFQPFPNDPFRLAIKVSDAAETLGLVTTRASSSPGTSGAGPRPRRGGARA